MQTIDLATQNELIKLECNNVKKVLIQKNTNYNGAALNPQGVFPKLSSIDTIRVRIDDKLNRLAKVVPDGTYFDEEDTVLDLLGYLVLYRIAKTRDEYDAHFDSLTFEVRTATPVEAETITRMATDDAAAGADVNQDSAAMIPAAAAPSVF